MSKTLLTFVASIALIHGLSTTSNAGQTESVDLFPAAEAGQIDVRVIPKNANQATILIENKTDRPLSVKLPEAFVGVMAQIGGQVGGGGGIGVGGGGQQAIGGGGGGGLGGGGLGGGGQFNVAPDSVRRVKVATVCLEHGKDDPSPRTEYVLKPIESFTSDARVIEICKLLGDNAIDTTSAQAAVWHVSAGLSWPQLAQKVKTKHLDGSVELYFNPQQLAQAARVVQAISMKQQDDAPRTAPEPYYGKN